MSTHIAAQPGDIAPVVLLPGDPLRAKHIAETYLNKPQCYSEVRGMYGFTGQHEGVPVSVQGTGMGMPSISIYAHELIESYGARVLIRVGTCGAIQRSLEVGDVVLAQSASTDSNMNRCRFDGLDFAPTASFRLLRAAVDAAERQGTPVQVGNVLTSDAFYNEKKTWALFAAYGTLVAEMEVAALYTEAARAGVEALAVLTVSDNVITGVTSSAETRQTAFMRMVEIALNVARNADVN